MSVAEDAPEPGGVLSEWITRKQLAAELGVSVDTLGRWESQRVGPPCIRVGRRVIYRRETVCEWLRRQEEHKREAFWRVNGGRA